MTKEDRMGWSEVVDGNRCGLFMSEIKEKFTILVVPVSRSQSGLYRLVIVMMVHSRCTMLYLSFRHKLSYKMKIKVE